MITLDYLTPQTIHITGGRISVLNSNAPDVKDQSLAFPDTAAFTKAVALRVDPATGILTTATYTVTDVYVLRNNFPAPPGSLIDICYFWTQGTARSMVDPLYTDVIASHNISFGNVAP